MPVEPIWWPRARALRAKGLTLGTIARLVKRPNSSVRYATQTEEWRQGKRRLNAEWYARHKTRRSRHNPARKRILNKAHKAAEATGQHVDEVLQSWGELPRRVKHD